MLFKIKHLILEIIFIQIFQMLIVHLQF